MTIESDIRRAERAKAILEEPIFEEAKKHMEAELFRLFQAVHPTDTEGLVQIKQIQYLHDKYLAFLRSAVSNGTLAKLELERTNPRPKGY